MWVWLSRQAISVEQQSVMLADLFLLMQNETEKQFDEAWIKTKEGDRDSEEANGEQCQFS